MCIGSLTITDKTIMLIPIAQITCNQRVWYSPIQEKLISVNSIAMRIKPRLNKKLLGDLYPLLEEWENNHADRPVKYTNAGAHKCANIRAKNKSIEVFSISIGSDTCICKYILSRT